MTRSSFFKSLFMGIVATPAVVKVLAEERTKKQHFSFSGWDINPEWGAAQYRVEFIFPNGQFSGTPQDLMYAMVQCAVIKEV